MEIQEALVEYVKADAGIVAISGGRIRPQFGPAEDGKPVTSYLRAGNKRFPSQEGPNGLVRSRIQFDHWGTNYLQLLQLAAAYRKALEGFRGTMGSGPGVAVNGVFLDSETDSYESDQTPPMRRIRQDYFVWHKEAIA